MGKYDDLDAFWDLGRLMPKKKKLTPFNTTTTPRDHHINGDPVCSAEERRLTLTPADGGLEQIEERSYRPERTGLIREVTIRRWIDKYDFYGSFRKAAIVYYEYKTDKCDFAPYYSYMPQYSQLTTHQKQYYFYWRDMVRRGKFIKSDYSYLYLFVYEILNLPDKLPPEEGLLLLCRLWREYRDQLPKIDVSFAIWIQDYCLVHQLPCPMDQISEFIFDVISASSFKEFYLSEIGIAGNAGTDAMIAYLSDYDFRRCKYRTAENKDSYTKYMLGAMSGVISAMMYGANPIYDITKTQTVERDAFPRSLCTHAVKCRLKIEYVPLSQDARLRAIVTMAVRYTENKLRAHLGVKSRLAIKDLPEQYKAIIDGYFNSLVGARVAKAAKESIPEYEALYDAPREALSIQGADRIERASWQTTARLVGDSIEDSSDSADGILADAVIPVFGVTNAPQEDSGAHREALRTQKEDANTHIENCIFKNITEKNENAPPSRDFTDEVDTYGLSADEILLIEDIMQGRIKAFDLVIEEKTEKINEAFAIAFGDVIIETQSDEYQIIEDYKEDVEKWLMKIKK